MAYEQRLKLIKQIEELRGSKVVSYLTSLRPNLGAVMADDGVRVFFDHLLLLPSRPIKQLDIFLCSNGELAIGNVERFISQSRLIARKILGTHMNKETDQHKIDETMKHWLRSCIFMDT